VCRQVVIHEGFLAGSQRVHVYPANHGFRDRVVHQANSYIRVLKKMTRNFIMRIIGAGRFPALFLLHSEGAF
jgi:hypothetical protein